VWWVHGGAVTHGGPRNGAAGECAGLDAVHRGRCLRGPLREAATGGHHRARARRRRRPPVGERLLGGPDAYGPKLAGSAARARDRPLAGRTGRRRGAGPFLDGGAGHADRDRGTEPDGRQQGVPAAARRVRVLGVRRLPAGGRAAGRRGCAGGWPACPSRRWPSGGSGPAQASYQQIFAAVLADPAHFTRMDTLEHAWRVVGPILDTPAPRRCPTGPARGDRMRRRARPTYRAGPRCPARPVFRRGTGRLGRRLVVTAVTGSGTAGDPAAGGAVPAPAWLRRRDPSLAAVRRAGRVTVLPASPSPRAGT
jgi:hypothetical protein